MPSSSASVRADPGARARRVERRRPRNCWPRPGDPRRCSGSAARSRLWSLKACSCELSRPARPFRGRWFGHAVKSRRPGHRMMTGGLGWCGHAARRVGRGLRKGVSHLLESRDLISVTQQLPHAATHATYMHVSRAQCLCVVHVSQPHRVSQRYNHAQA